MTPQLASRIWIVVLAIFVVVMIGRVIVTHLRYRRARRGHEAALQNVRAALDRADTDAAQAAFVRLVHGEPKR